MTTTRPAADTRKHGATASPAPRPLVTDPNPAAIAAAAETVARTSTSRAAVPRRSLTVTKAIPSDEEERKKVQDVGSREDFDKLLEDAANKIVMIEFYAQWCGACKLIGHRLKELAESYVDKAIIARIDVEECEDIAMDFKISSVPTFVYIKNKKNLTLIVGSNQAKMEETLEKLVTGVGLHAAAAAPAPAPAGAGRSND